MADPFDVSRIETADPVGIKSAIRAASLRLLAAIETMAEEEEHRPIVVEKADIPAYYHVSALAMTLRSLALNEPVGDVVSLYVPIDMMRIGRVRAVLHTAAEWAASVGKDAALAAWIAKAFESPDTELAEWGALEPFSAELEAFLASLAADPLAAAHALFGEPAVTREGSDDLEVTMRVSVARVSRLDTDPDEETSEGAANELAVDDPMSEAFTTAMDAENGENGEESPRFEDLAAAYVVAYTRENLSPVVARGIEAYSAQGTSAMSEEMKVSKAPTKTLAAVLKYATHSKRAGAIFLDRFEMWPSVPDDMRMKIVSTLTSLRWALKDDAGLILLLTPEIAREVDEAFGAAPRVRWDFGELAAVESPDAAFDVDAVSRWIASASPEGVAPAWCDPLLAAVPEGTPLAAAIDALQAAIKGAAEKGETEPDADEMLRLLADSVEVG
jgi:hypothetical protein